jgi:hypothetical protein
MIRIIESRRMSWAGHVARKEKKRNAHRLLVGKSEGRQPLSRTRRGCVDNIKMDLAEIGWGSVDWIGLDQDREKRKAVVNAVMTFRVL